MRFTPPLPKAALFQLDDWAAIRFDGPQTREFLHSQLTNDVLTQPPGVARLNGLCSPKGRLLASMFVMVGSEEQIDLLVSADLAEGLLKRLSMFVLRSKTKGRMLRESHRLVAAMAAAEVALPDHQQPTDNYPIHALDNVQWLALPQVGLPSTAGGGSPPSDRWLGLASIELNTPPPEPSQKLAWAELEVLSGIARISQATQDLFVPQTINFELAHGVSFTKGCYPGQEVVARSQYLGKMKRRMGIGWLSGPALIGGDVANTSAQPVGRIVMSATASQGGAWVQFEAATDDAAAGGLLHQGLPIVQYPLPYAIPEPVAPNRPKL